MEKAYSLDSSGPNEKRILLIVGNCLHVKLSPTLPRIENSLVFNWKQNYQGIFRLSCLSVCYWFKISHWLSGSSVLVTILWTDSGRGGGLSIKPGGGSEDHQHYCCMAGGRWLMEISVTTKEFTNGQDIIQTLVGFEQAWTPILNLTAPLFTIFFQVLRYTFGKMSPSVKYEG